MAPIDAFLALANAATGPISLASVIERCDAWYRARARARRRRSCRHTCCHHPAHPACSALKAKDVWQFGELLDVPAVRGLATTEQAEWLRLLEIFAFGTYGDYKGACGRRGCRHHAR